ncbi:Hypothetical predicted protein [Paramuricea clavata]|uniref:Uncharacterized protein n=1 Tax=Paramuricea clavata TaxID=317549 RepID=A0A6S7G4R8_PARCT|nr:Hypothetical predicted protein [Paramuricea clavata]
MLKLQSDGGLTSPNAMRIENDKPKTAKSTTNQPEQQEMDKIIAKYDHLFQGIGKITDKKNNREIYGQFHMQPEAIPITQKPRPVPYHLQKSLKEWLQQGVKEDIFEQVPDDEPVTWCSPLVIQPKPRFAKTPTEELGTHMIRASVDLRVPNKYMEQSRRNLLSERPIIERKKEIDKRDKEYTKRMAHQKRNVKKHKFALKDYVLVKQKKTNNWTTAFEPAFYTITKTQGSSITIRRIKDGRELCRDASQLKPANSLVGTEKYPMQLADDEEEEESTWDRETDEETADGEVEQVRPAENEGTDRPRRERQQPARRHERLLYILS